MMFENEVWAVVEEFSDYLVSDLGRIRHKDRLDARQPAINKQGFPVIQLTRKPDPMRYLRQVNRLVATAFLPVPDRDDYNSVWHIDGDLTNCAVDNLRWDTRRRVLEWNDMHRRTKPKLKTPPVKNNRTGIVYPNAFEAALADGILESSVVWQIERKSHSMFSEDTPYRYVTASHPV